jgi:hypothetical protein
MVIVDDALLLAIIAERQELPIESLLAQVAQGEVFTTGSWYWRVTRAVSGSGQGALSRHVSALRDEERLRVLSALSYLPSEVGLLSLRRLVPVMAALGGQLNLLTAEAIAAAVVLQAEIVVTTNSPLLTQAAEAAGVTVRIVSLSPP